MTDVARDLGTKLDWIAVDHWNTDNPHIHVLIRGRAEDGQDLVISRDYISRGFRDRAAERVTLELGPRSERDIQSALEREVEAERWTSLDRALCVAADEGAGVADLRPNASGEDMSLRRLMVGRAARLERLGLADQVAPGCWTLKPGIEDKLRDLSIRGDVIKTMHRAMSVLGREPDISGFALHGEEPTDPVLGRLVERGLHDELKGSAYAVVEGIDGRTHHIRFTDIEMTGDAAPGAIVEARSYDDARAASGSRSPPDGISVLRLRSPRRERPGLTGSYSRGNRSWRAVVSDPKCAKPWTAGLTISQAKVSRAGRGQGSSLPAISSIRLRQQELDATVAKLSAETGLAHNPSSEGERIVGIYRQRVTLASGRFAMIDDGLGFQLVPWRPALGAASRSTGIRHRRKWRRCDLELWKEN